MRLISEPTLNQFPVLPEGFRWKIARPMFDSEYGRRVYIQQKRGLFWKNVEWSLWRTWDGLGDLRNTNSEDWWRMKGLASTVGYVLSKFYDSYEFEKYTLTERRYLVPNSNLHGVSKR